MSGKTRDKNEKNPADAADKKHKTAILQLTGATCPSCRHAIRHIGGKIKGVENIDIDPLRDIIQLKYAGSDKSVLEIQKLVSKLGYHAEWVE